MPRVYISSVIDAPAAKVWERIRDFNGLPRWHPRIRDSRIENGEPADRSAASATSTCRTATASARSCWAVGLRLLLHLCDPRKPDAADRLHRHAAADPGHRRRPHLRRMDAEFDCAEDVAEGLVTGIGNDVFQAGFDALKRQMAG
jgi:hypothetical protein